MEAFEKELNESRAKDGEGEDADGAPIDDVDEAELGDDPFARGGEAAVVDAGGEAWLNSDRDYTYAEVRFAALPHVRLYAHFTCLIAAPALLWPAARVEPRPLKHCRQATHTRTTTTYEGRKQKDSL